VPLSNMLLLLLPSSIMASEDKGQRTELTRKERERRATIPLLRRLVSERHHQQHQRCEAERCNPDQSEIIWTLFDMLMMAGVNVPLGLMMNPVESHLNSLVRVEARAQLPPFCLVTQDFPPMSLDGVRVVAGSVIPPPSSS
jgi:hypothetical protein